MSATAEEVLATLKSMNAALLLLVEHFGCGAKPAATAGSPVPSVASDRDLDGQYGDPKSRCDPRDWTGDSFKGQLLSTCPPNYLDLYADLLGWFAQKNDENNEKDNKGRPKSHWDRKDAALARGWAARLRNGWTAPEPDEAFPSDTAAPATPLTDDAMLNDSDIPF